MKFSGAMLTCITRNAKYFSRPHSPVRTMASTAQPSMLSPLLPSTSLPPSSWIAFWNLTFAPIQNPKMRRMKLFGSPTAFARQNTSTRRDHYSGPFPSSSLGLKRLMRFIEIGYCHTLLNWNTGVVILRSRGSYLKIFARDRNEIESGLEWGMPWMTWIWRL